MSVIGRDVMERGAPPWGWEAPSAGEVRESLSHTDMQAWTAASSHNRPQAVRSTAALSGEEKVLLLLLFGVNGPQISHCVSLCCTLGANRSSALAQIATTHCSVC